MNRCTQYIINKYTTMKVYQIIKEDYDWLSLTNPIASSDGNTATGSSDKPKAGDVKTKTDEPASGLAELVPDDGPLRALFNIDYQALALPALTGTLLAAGSTVALSSVFKKYAKNLKIYNKAEQIVSDKYAPKWIALLKVAGALGAIYELYSNLMMNEAFYLQGKYDKAEGGADAKYKEMREFLWGVFTIQMLPGVIASATKWLIGLSKAGAAAIGVTSAIGKVSSAIAKKSKNIVIRFIAGFAPRLAAKLGLVSTIAWHGFFVWLQTWLGSAAGQAWLYKWVGSYVITIGKVGDQAFEELMDMYTGTVKAVTGKEPTDKGIMPSTYDQAEKKKYGDGEAGKKAKAANDPMAKVKRIDDIMVTDTEGYLLPTALWNRDLKQIRKDAIANGQPDPLAEFPRKPNSNGQVPPLPAP